MADPENARSAKSHGRSAAARPEEPVDQAPSQEGVHRQSYHHGRLREALIDANDGSIRAEIDVALEQVESDDPLDRFRPVGTAYLRWALRNPMHFRVISARALIDLDGSEIFQRHNSEIRELMTVLLAEAQRRGMIWGIDATLVPLAAPALVCGLACMHVDGHLAQWGVAPDEAERRM
jgi:hypothetical protein